MTAMLFLGMIHQVRASWQGKKKKNLLGICRRRWQRGVREHPPVETLLQSGENNWRRPFPFSPCLNTEISSFPLGDLATPRLQDVHSGGDKTALRADFILMSHTRFQV